MSTITVQTPALVNNNQPMDSNLINAPPVKQVVVPSKPRGRPKKVLTEDEVIDAEIRALEKNQRKLAREIAKAAKATKVVNVDVVEPKTRGRPKKVRTHEELAVIANELETKEQRKLEREIAKAAADAEPKRPVGRPKKVRTSEELEAIAKELEAKEQRKADRVVKKAAKDAEKAAKAVAMFQKRVEILAKRTVALDEYEAKWALTYTGNN